MVSVNFLVIWVISALFMNAAVAAVREYRKWVRETEHEDRRAREEWAEWIEPHPEVMGGIDRTPSPWWKS